MEGYRTLKAREEVEFEVVDGDKGQQAADVKSTGRIIEEEQEQE